MRVRGKYLGRALLCVGMAAAVGESGGAGAVQIAGTVTSKAKVVRVAAIDRVGADVLKTSLAEAKDPFVYEGTYDAATQRFQVDHLLPGRTYDLVFWTKAENGEETRWAGVTMDYHRPILAAEGVTAEDRKWLEDFVTQMPAFYDKSRVLHMAADHKHATLLVELARTRDFHSDKGGEIIYRVELWYFENLFGGWAKDKNTESVMVRWRGEGKESPKRWQFLPELGGLRWMRGGIVHRWRFICRMGRPRRMDWRASFRSGRGQTHWAFLRAAAGNATTFNTKSRRHEGPRRVQSVSDGFDRSIRFSPQSRRGHRGRRDFFFLCGSRVAIWDWPAQFRNGLSGFGSGGDK